MDAAIHRKMAGSSLATERWNNSAANKRSSPRLNYRTAAHESIPALCYGQVAKHTVPILLVERYANDAIVHCQSQIEGLTVMNALEERFRACGL
jgi:hypothetical protein